jgi:hypothetical protein
VAAKSFRRGGRNTVRGTRKRLFYSVFLPAAVALNLTFGLMVLDNLEPRGWLGGLEVATGAFCCVVAGWLAAAAWSRSYWTGAIARQVAAWRQVTDAIFGWMEEKPPSAEELQRLKGSLDHVLK